MSQRKRIQTLLLSTLMVSCSTGNDLSKLKAEHQQYTYSSYAKENLNAHPSPARNHSPSVNPQLANVKKHIVAQKQQANQTIHATIQHNGIFTPTKNLQQQAATLHSQISSERWLQAQPNLTTVLTLALRNNINIKSSLQNAKASIAKYDQISFLNDTLAQYAAFTNKPADNNFPFPGLLSLKGSIIDQAVESARLELKQTVQDTITQARLAYYELQQGQQDIAVINTNIKLLQLLKKQLENTLITTKINISTIYLADIEIAKNINKKKVTQTLLSKPQAQLNALLNLSAHFKLNKLPPLEEKQIKLSVPQLLTTAKAHRVEIQQLQSTIKKVARIIRLSEKRFYPDFSAGYSRFLNQASLQTGSNASKPSFSTRPDFKKQNFFGVNDAYLSETKLKHQALQTKLQALINKTESDIQQTLSQYQVAQHNYQLYQAKIIPLSKQTKTIAQSMFETGDSSYPEVIKSEQMIIDARLLTFEALKAMNSNLAKLSRIVGSEI